MAACGLPPERAPPHEWRKPCCCSAPSRVAGGRCGGCWVLFASARVLIPPRSMSRAPRVVLLQLFGVFGPSVHAASFTARLPRRVNGEEAAAKPSLSLVAKCASHRVTHSPRARAAGRRRRCLVALAEQSFRGGGCAAIVADGSRSMQLMKLG